MAKYITKKIAFGATTIFISIMINFLLVRLVPGDPIQIISGIQNPNPQMILELKSKYGLDKPLIIQFFIYLKDLSKGDLGYSYFNNKPTIELISDRVVPTFLMVLTGLFFSIIIGVITGIFSAKHNEKLRGKIVNMASYFLSSIPSFLLSMEIIIIFSVKLKLFPTSGMYNSRASYSGLPKFFDLLYHMFLPVLTIVLIESSHFCKITRASIIGAMKEDYVTTLIAFGINSKKIINKYVFKNTLLPIISTISISLSYLFIGITLIEIVFSWPGMGRLIMDSILKRDYIVLSGIFLIFSIFTILIMLFSDIAYCIIDKRIYNTMSTQE